MVGPHRTARHTGRSLGRTCIVDGMILEIFGHRLTSIQAFLNLGVCDVATHDDGAVERKTSRNGVLVELCENFRHGAIEVNLHRFTFTSLAIFFGDEATGIVVEFFNPDTVFV